MVAGASPDADLGVMARLIAAARAKTTRHATAAAALTAPRLPPSYTRVVQEALAAVVPIVRACKCVSGHVLGRAWQLTATTLL